LDAINACGLTGNNNKSEKFILSDKLCAEKCLVAGLLTIGLSCGLQKGLQCPCLGSIFR
jgi:hypothetical protein